MDKLEFIPNTSGGSDIGSFFEHDINYFDKLKEKSKNFLYCSENRKIDSDNFTAKLNTEEYS